MKTGFVVALSMAFLVAGREFNDPDQVGNYVAGFHMELLREQEPSRADGVSMVGEPDWDAAEASEEEAAAEASSGEWVSLGDDWVITYYCPLECCNDQWAWQTSTMEPMQLHHTIAVDPSVIPYYSHVRIGGLDYEYVAEDCGGGIKGKRIDVLVENCAMANELGVDRNIEVWVKK